MRILQHFRKYDLSPLLSILLVCIFPCVFVCTQNAAVADLTGALKFLCIYLLCAGALALIALPFLRNFSRAAVFSNAAMLVIINFTMIADGLEKLLPWLRDWHLFVLFGVLMLALFLLLLLKKPDLRIACTLIAIAFGAVTLMNLALAVPAFYARANSSETTVQASAAPGISAAPAPTAETNQPETAAAPAPEKSTAEDALQAASAADADANTDADAEQDTAPAQEEIHDDPAAGIARFTAEEQPNVYWMIFDEYGGYENLQHYFGYDNNPFLNQLEERGFNVARESRNTEAVYTHIIMPNMVNLDYVVDVEKKSAETAPFMDNSYVVRMFLENGYQVNLADHLDYIGHTGCNVLTVNQSDKSVSDLLLGKSIFSRSEKLQEDLDERFDVDSDADYYGQIGNVLQAELDSWEYAQDGPTLTIGYVQSPHSPLVLGRDGEPNPRKQYYNWNDDSNYLNQLEYTSDFILELVDTILEHDPDALIILQSDHGCRYPIHQIQMGKTDRCDPETEYPHIENILNCVYYRGETMEIEGETAINTLRTAFNQALGTHFDRLEPVYTWLDISDRITPFH